MNDMYLSLGHKYGFVTKENRLDIVCYLDKFQSIRIRGLVPYDVGQYLLKLIYSYVISES